MSCSCSTIDGVVEEQSDLCPTCKQRGKSVGNFTINALVSPARSRGGGYPDGRYCANPDCDTLYFFDEDIEPISKDELTVEVGFKQQSSSHMVCYCYDHTSESIRTDFQEHGESTIEAQIREKVNSGSCTCEAKNPKGSCCLGDVRTTYLEVKDLRRVDA